MRIFTGIGLIVGLIGRVLLWLVLPALFVGTFVHFYDSYWAARPVESLELIVLLGGALAIATWAGLRLAKSAEE